MLKHAEPFVRLTSVTKQFSNGTLALRGLDLERGSFVRMIP